MKNIERASSLNPVQKEAIGLLSIGTFLEYFDLMLYVHMAVLLNELFFPKTDPFTASLLSAFAFSSTYVLRPFGALIFGYIGDKIGRKSTVIITTMMMSISCLIMANLPTYAQVGITASWIITICRMVQGLSTMGEVIGANIYITEITKPPIQYPAVALMAIFGTLGGTVSLGIASLVTSYEFNWRTAFWLGAGIAIIGAAARTRLRETQDFADAKRRVKKALANTNQDPQILKENLIWNEKVNKKTALSLFFIECSWPVCFYFAYMYCGNILKVSFNFTPEQIIHQNFIVSIIQLISWIILAFLSYKIYPLKILKVKLIIFLAFIVVCPYLLYYVSSSFQILLIQSFVVIFGFMGTPAVPIFYKHLPIFRRFTYATFTYALSRAFIYIVTSFGFVYCSNYFGHWGILIIMIPTAIAFTYGLHHFETIEKVDFRRHQMEVDSSHHIT
jgi:MFS transporter, MHS family, proline/betaine transporter